MRQFTSLCSLCRHNVLFNHSIRTSFSNVPRRQSSLSAIHRGLRDSEKSRPQGFASGALKTTGTARTKRTTSRQRVDPDWTPPSFKLTKGKKDITDEGPQPKSRRKRFNDPTESFGKKSVVYRAKHGDLREQLAAMTNDRAAPRMKESFESKFTSKFDDQFRNKRKPNARDRNPRERSTRSSAFSRANDTRRSTSRSADSFDRRPERPERSRRDLNSSRFETSSNKRDRDWETPEKRERDYSDRENRPSGFARFENRVQDNAERRSRDFSSDRPRRSPRSFESDRANFSDRPSRPSGFTRATDYTNQRSSPSRRDDPPVSQTNSMRDDLPIRIHHTTAASQFLYGRSVVEAALKDSKRQLYHLYLYAGEDRKNLVQDASVQKLAERNGVEVTKITTNDGLRMMDKMSVGRPHNGCVLEASPLPQMPLKNLGALSEDPSKSGFSVELAYQSSEEAAINGTTNFIPLTTKSSRKPFFLLLDGILDPGNLGAILRTAAFLGVTGVVISKSGSSGLTPVSLKASAGASEVLPLYAASSTLDFIERSKEAGWMIYASVAAGPRSRGNSHLTLERVESYDPLSEHPTILVIGSEGEGLAKQVRRLADFEVSIPGNPSLLSTVDSLNVSVATGILCSAFLKKSQGFEIEETLDEVVDRKDDETQLW